jgi:hypothetical protein
MISLDLQDNRFSCLGRAGRAPEVASGEMKPSQH